MLSIKKYIAAGLLFILFSCNDSVKSGEENTGETIPSHTGVISTDNLDEKIYPSESTPVLVYPHYTIPESRSNFSPCDIDTEQAGILFNIPVSVKKEKVAFKTLVDPPEAAEQIGGRYVLVTADETAIHSHPSAASRTLGFASAGELFLLEAKQDLPENPEELPVPDYENLRERFELEWEFFLETYLKRPGVIVDGFYNTWIKVANRSITGWIFRAYTCESSYDNLVFLRELYKRGSAFISYQDYIIDPPPATQQISGAFEEIRSRKRSFSSTVKRALAGRYVVRERMDAAEMTLSASQPDYLLAWYHDAASSRLNPLFITTDLVFHAFCLIMNQAIREIDEKYFYPFIQRMLRYCFDRLLLYREGTEEEKMRKCADYLIGCFGMGLHLLGNLNDSDRAACGNEVLNPLMKEAALLDEVAGTQRVAGT
ncbi:MAG: DUF3160 domain-containing protein, partial [Spirochaetales bacterium]|nr:DUF3160 domain-containing protein [Spirochaetales bacterium]